MQEETVIIKEEIDIDDTKIKLEVEEDEEMPVLEFSCASGLMKIIEERPNMITVPVNDYKSEDEIKFIASLGTLDQQQKLFVTSPSGNDGSASPSAFECKICNFKCENHLALASHQIKHQFNCHFCCYGCGVWCDTLEEILEHEYRQHSTGFNNFNCRICNLDFHDAVSLVRHMGSHFYVRRFVCALCRSHFETRHGLQLHRQHSTELCGCVEYVDTHGNVGQLVAISKPDSQLPELPAELLCDVKIKSEPLEDEEHPKPILESETETGVYIKKEPKEEPDESGSSRDASWLDVSSTSLPGEFRAKLRLPSLKKPLKEKPTAKDKETAHLNPNIQFVPAEKWKPIPMPNSVASAKRPNILKPMKDNNRSVLKKHVKLAPKTNPNVAANILKVLPSNCMLIKLPPNTKIVKIAPTPTTATNNTNSCTIGSKVFTLPSAITIKPKSPLIPATSPSTSTSPKSALEKVAAISPPVNRNAYFSDLSLFESLPESRKIITEFQNQIRSIEQTCPLPGTVLQIPKKCSPSGSLPLKLEELHLPLTKVSHGKVRELRVQYPSHRFHWECPKCARCYEQYTAFCNHLTFEHSIEHTDFHNIKVNVKTYKKSPFPDSEPTPLTPSITDPIVPTSTKPVTYTSVPSALATSEVTDKVVSSKKATPLVPALPDPVITHKKKAAALMPATSRASKATRQSPNVPSSARATQSQCDDCSKWFTTVGALRIHKMIHTGELPHKCSYCEKRFRTPGQVRVHQRRHTGEKPFKCKVCSLDFTHRETLISHLSRHIGMKRYKCYGCDKNFVVVSGLRAHRRLRPDTCGKVKFTARAHGPRVRVIRGEVFFESHPEHNGYLRSEDPLNILSEIGQPGIESAPSSEAVS